MEKASASPNFQGPLSRSTDSYPTHDGGPPALVSLAETGLVESEGGRRPPGKGGIG